uniref:Uncharacterized protein n=1 Tax=Coccidioides posadasii RMSCC 3488 TaxID=454284 RepID=A0A0J6FIK9_COCPO|nr:hypothetical protein CPAG_06435 [Coccidioides posadasii RMSCC 3488]
MVCVNDDQCQAAKHHIPLKPCLGILVPNPPDTKLSTIALLNYPLNVVLLEIQHLNLSSARSMKVFYDLVVPIPPAHFHKEAKVVLLNMTYPFPIAANQPFFVAFIT